MKSSLILGILILIVGICIQLFHPLPWSFLVVYYLRVIFIVLHGVILVVFWFFLKIVKKASQLFYVLLVLSTIGIGFAIFGFFLNNEFPFWLVLDPRHTIPEIMLFISSVAVTSFSIKNVYYSISLNKEEPLDKSKESNIIIITVVIIHLGLIMLVYLIVLIANSWSVSPQPPPGWIPSTSSLL